MVVLGCSSKPQRDAISKTYFYFDTVIQMKIFDDGKSEEIFTGVNKILQTVEQEISRTNTESEIAKINNHAGLSAVKVSKSTFELISTAVNYARDTNGKFNPAIGPLVNLWGIGHEGVKKP